MKAFVTGATGYIGHELMQYLLNLDFDIHALVRDPSRQQLTDPRITWFKGDLNQREAVAAAMNGCSHVFHLAAYARPWAKDPQTYFRINVEGTTNVLREAWANRVERLVYSSSCAVFGKSEGQPVRETDVRAIDFFTEYESSKFMAENQVLQYAKKGLPAMIVSPSRVYGEGKWTESNALSMLIKRYIDGKWHIIPGDGKALGCFSYIRDVVEGHWLAATNGKAGERYILGGDNASMNDFFDRVKRISGKNYYLVHIPTPLLMIFGWKEEMGAALFGREPLITRKWIRKYHYHLDCSSEKAINEIGYRFTSLDDGLRETITWLMQEKKV